jgi:hypothetical protein
MVDREARDKLALATRRFAAGRISEHEWEESLPRKTKDDTLSYVAETLESSYEWYPRYKDYFAVGEHAFTRAERRAVARHIVFLHTNLDYTNEARLSVAEETWDMIRGLGGCVLRLSLLPAVLAMITVALALRVVPRLGKDLCGKLLKWFDMRVNPRTEEDELWPFRSRSDLENALRKPRFFCGRPA